MRLLFDQNLSYELVSALADLYPDSLHLHFLKMGAASDDRIWRYARLHNLIIVTKDRDFHYRSIVFGHPPKVVWMRVGNCSVSHVEILLRIHYDDLQALEQDGTTSALILS